MGQPAARIGDVAAHGGAIIFGTPTVLIGGMPAARMGDPLACPGFNGPVPHVMGNVTMASTTVMIGGAFAARMGDMTGCGAAGVSGAGLPPVAGPAAAPAAPGNFDFEQNYGGEIGHDSEGNSEDNAGVLYLRNQSIGNGDGSEETVTGSLLHFHGETENFAGEPVEGTLDIGTFSSTENHSGDPNDMVEDDRTAASAAVLTGSVRVRHRDGGSDTISVTALGGGLNSHAFLGSDGRRTGIGAGMSASVGGLEIQGDSVSVTHIPFTDYTFNSGVTIGGAFAGAGGAVNAGAFHDAADERYHLMGMMDLEFIFGAKVGLDFSIGRATAANATAGTGTPGIPVPLTPGSIVTGCPTVLIG